MRYILVIVSLVFLAGCGTDPMPLSPGTWFECADNAQPVVEQRDGRWFAICPEHYYSP